MNKDITHEIFQAAEQRIMDSLDAVYCEAKSRVLRIEQERVSKVLAAALDRIAEEAHKETREEAIELLETARTNILSGYCMCCGEKPCDHSTTGCPWEYRDYDVATTEITKAIFSLQGRTPSEAKSASGRDDSENDE